MKKDDPITLSGSQLTCDEIYYKLQVGRINEHVAIRLTLERLESLEKYVNDIKEANKLYDGR